MFPVILTATAAFLGTNLDDILILTLLFAQAKGGRAAIAAGQLAGIGVLTTVSFLGARLMQGLPAAALALPGLIPIALGVRAWVQYHRNPEPEAVSAVGFTQTMLLTLANGGDNLGVYIPLFAGYGPPQMAMTAGVFALMTALWCLLGIKLAKLPALGVRIRRYRHILVPAVLIALGIYILLEHTVL